MLEPSLKPTSPAKKYIGVGELRVSKRRGNLPRLLHIKNPSEGFMNGFLNVG